MKLLDIIFSSTFTPSVPVNPSASLGGRDAYLCKEVGTVSVRNVGRFGGERRLRVAQNIVTSLRFQPAGEKFGRLQGYRRKPVNGGFGENKKENEKAKTMFNLNVVTSVGLSVPK